MRASLTRRAALGTALALPALRRAHAEVGKVLVSKQFGTLYLQQDVMERQGLIQKHDARLGLPGLRAGYIKFAGTGPVTEALLAGSLHFASGGAPGALLLWDRTRGAVKSAFAMNATNQRLPTVNPAVRAIADLGRPRPCWRTAPWSSATARFDPVEVLARTLFHGVAPLRDDGRAECDGGGRRCA